MMNSKAHCHIPWIRDEVILALNAYIHSANKTFNIGSTETKQLSGILKELPIKFRTEKPNDFRNENGIHFQMSKLHTFLCSKSHSIHIGYIFKRVVEEYWSNNRDELNKVAEAILFASIKLRERSETVPVEWPDWPEGKILHYYHIYLEKTHRNGIDKVDTCQLCGMSADVVYRNSMSCFLETHLVANPTECQRNSIGKCNWIVLCPNCHKAVHWYRPWLSAQHMKNILVWKA